MQETHRRRSPKCQRGEIPIGPILVIAVIVIPLMISLTMFNNEMLGWLESQWGQIKGAEDPPYWGTDHKAEGLSAPPTDLPIRTK